jgi:hypothetical protein
MDKNIEQSKMCDGYHNIGKVIYHSVEITWGKLENSHRVVKNQESKKIEV